MMIVIDMVGNDDDDPDELTARELEHQRKVAIEDIARRAPVPQLVEITA